MPSIQEILLCSILTPYGRLDKMEEGDDIQGYLQSKTGQRTVPNVFISAYYIRFRVYNNLNYSLYLFRAKAHRW